MKKIILALAVALTSTVLFAEEPHRFFEFGVNVHAGISNNYFKVSDFYNNNEDRSLTIDLNEMVKALGDNGLGLTADMKTDLYMNLNLSKDLRIGLFTDISFNSYNTIPTQIFQLLAEEMILEQLIRGHHNSDSFYLLLLVPKCICGSGNSVSISCHHSSCQLP
jgi:hypothetical protein